MNEREKWFKDRIGKVVYRNRMICDCSVCEGIYQNGTTLDAEDWSLDMESEYDDGDEFPVHHFDTREERDKFTQDNSYVLMKGFWESVKKEYKGRDAHLLKLYNRLIMLVKENDIVSLNHFLTIATGDTDTDRIVHIVNALKPISHKLCEWDNFNNAAIQIDRIKDLNIL